ncbi:uncharacterized protein LOC135844912 isoform X12 [Planococcus citri]|uniref:uncharacterized protein LOC135844912 isoform X12 n=1 Tax=Planococcus citri TaxID=170843 RepID=UPI0031F7B136
MSSLEPHLCNFLQNPCSLEHTASVVSAAVLCSRMNPTNPKKIREIIALPPVIEQNIERFMPMVTYRIKSWSRFYDREIFFDTRGGRAHEYYHVLIWSTDGTINDEKTAREMLKQDGLNALEKYRIACNHCLETEIRTLRSNLGTLKNTERYYPLLYYWECVIVDGAELTSYINKNILTRDFAYPVCTNDYFLNRLHLRERIIFLRESHLFEMPFKNWVNFLKKLTNEEFGNPRHFTIDLHIMQYLIRFWMHADFVVQVWIRIRDNYSNDKFSYLIEELLNCGKSQFESADFIPLAVEIFSLAPYRLQKAVFNEYLKQDWWDRYSNLTDIRLDVAILSTYHPDYKGYKFWSTKWFDLFKRYPTDCFVQFMNTCCEEERSEEFKRKILEMNDHEASNYCFTLLREMRFSEIDHFISIFASDPGRIMKTKQAFLRNNFSKWTEKFENGGSIFPPPNQLVDFIEGSFENIRSANEFKIEVLSSVNCLKSFYNFTGSDMFGWLKDAVSMCSCNDDDFKLYKNKFLQLGVEMAKASKCDIPDVFNDSGWMSFLKWCSDEC